MNFRGLFTALITPFSQDGAFDEAGLRILITRQITARVDGIVILGSTGEAATLTKKEKERVIHIACEMCEGKLPVIVGTGSNCTRSTIEQTQLAEKLGASGALVVTPYYNKPTQEGLYTHFTAIADATNLPIILYNIAGRTAVNLATATLLRLIEVPNIVSIKEVSGQMDQIIDVIARTKQIRPKFSVLSGDDAFTLPMLSLGGDGLISVTSNVYPEQIMELVHTCLSGNFKEAQKLHEELLPTIRSIFTETNPIPLKALMEIEGMPAGPPRLPLTPLSEKNRSQLKRLSTTSSIV